MIENRRRAHEAADDGQARTQARADFIGWNPADVMLWKINNGGESYEELVRRATPSREEQLRLREEQRQERLRRKEQLEERRKRKFLKTQAMVAEIMSFPKAGSESKPEGRPARRRAHWRGAGIESDRFAPARGPLT